MSSPIMVNAAELWLMEDEARRVTIQYGGTVATGVRFRVRTGRFLEVTQPDSTYAAAPRWIDVASITGIVGVPPPEGEL